MVPEQNRKLLLPAGLSSRSDLTLVITELENIDKFLQGSALRQPGSNMQLPKTSKVFEQLVSGSNLNMLVAQDRLYLAKSLNWLRSNAPMIHVSFATDPSPVFVQKLTEWLRINIAPFLFIQIGLHPNIGAGCVVRTTNKYFDFTLRKRFAKHRELLMQQIKTGTSEQSPVSAPNTLLSKESS